MRRLELARVARQQGMKLLVASDDRKRRHDHDRGSAGGEDEESTARRKRPRNKKSKEETRTSQDHKRDQPRPEQKELCQGCGRTGPTRDKCMLSKHPDFNKNGKWADSAALRVTIGLGPVQPDGSETERSTFRPKRSKGTTLATLHNDSWCEDLLSCVVGCGSDMLHTSAAVRIHIQTLLKASPSNARSTTVPHIRAVNACQL